MPCATAMATTPEVRSDSPHPLPRWCVFQVQDEGPGLPAQARVAALPDRLDAASGRGLFLIHQCFEDVRWSRRGNRVQVAMRRA